MTIADAQTLFSDSQGPFAQGTNGSTNYYDLLVDRDAGKGEVLELLVQVMESVAGSGSTCDIRLVTDDNSSFSSPATLWSTGALAVSALAAGTVFKVKLPRGTERYIRINYVVATADQSAGKFWAAIVLNVDDNKTYPRAAYAVA